MITLLDIVNYQQELTEIAQRTAETAINTHHTFLDDGWNLVAIISLVIAIIALGIDLGMFLGINTTHKSVKEEAEKNRIDKDCQLRLFKDIARHLYRNKICTLTMWAKYLYITENEQKICFPSDEHILKLKLLPTDIHLESYYREANIYQQLHELELLLRNYNTEVDTAYQHIVLHATEIDNVTKIRDFTTLDFKTGYLTYRLIRVMDEIWKKENEGNQTNTIDSIFTLIKEANIKNCKDNKQEEHKFDKQFNIIRQNEEQQDFYFTQVFANPNRQEEFKKMLDKDIVIEAGHNNRGEEKIHMITLA